ncbi:hypothetical protein FJT64_016730 [Amphibalanus amphitrite]|uniref:Uncharacterized protein n=1 Tax=Amphibalanus amphitrite TaxID=1232801 RepID=A0A6A4WYD1_AMPAM|nr:hypothetical protein FJT64_016730 [Amphibalanus amphitrite]
MPFSRMIDPSTASPTGTVLFHNGMPYTYHNGMAVFPAQEYGGYPTQPQYPVMYSQPVIMPQQNFQYQPNQPQWPQSNSHWRWTAPIGYAPQPTSGHQYVYAHSVPPSQSAGLQLITIPQQPVAPAAGEFYVSQPPPVYHHQEAQAAATCRRSSRRRCRARLPAGGGTARPARQTRAPGAVKDGSSDWSETGLERLSALCLDEAAADGLHDGPPDAADSACAEDNSCSESGDGSARATPAGRERSPSPLPLTPPSSSVSPCADSVSSTTKSSSPQPPLGESGFASHPPKYTILAPQMSRMYMTPNAVPHYHIWTPYYTLQTSAGAIQAPAGGKGCPRHGYGAPLPPPSVPPPPLSPAGAPPPCWLHSAPPPPLSVHSSFPCPVPPPSNEPFSPSSGQMQRARYASPIKPALSRGGYICGPRAAGVPGRCGAGGLKQPDLGGAG